MIRAPKAIRPPLRPNVLRYVAMFAREIAYDESQLTRLFVAFAIRLCQK